MKKTIYVSLIASLLVTFGGCKPEPSLQEQMQANEQKMQSAQREALDKMKLEIQKQKAANEAKAKQ